ncbi:nucleotidyltransferase domain-containing protein [Actinorhabdospora filicis]|nr:hypothetical protein [Actinorhabdospora filicis]
MDFATFQSIYGPWAAPDPAGAAALLAGAPFRWWVAGGWALDAFTGVSRFHEDIDVVVLRRDLPAIREFFAGRHLWTAHAGAIRPLLPEWELEEEREQLWLRDDAYSPWLLDVLLTPDDGERLLFKRDHAIGLPLERAGWERDGVRYLAPELALLYKARMMREKDEHDFAAAEPGLTTAARSWLRESIERHLPGHGWLQRL